MKKRLKKNTAFYAEIKLIDDIRAYCLYNKISFSEIMNKLMSDFHKNNKEDIEICVEKQVQVDELLKKLMK